MTAVAEHLKVKSSSWQVVAAIPVCEPDAVLWLDRLLANLASVGVGVAWFLDNVSDLTFQKVESFPNTIGWGKLDDPSVPFREIHRQHPLNLAVRAGAEWMLRMDVDEELEPNAAVVMAPLLSAKCAWKARWYNVWRETTPLPLIRFDPPFRPADNYRVCLHPLRDYQWQFRPTAVASAYCNREIATEWSDLRLIHRGFSTPELRRMHKERWDRLYAPNPYGMWNAACDEAKEAWLWPWMPWLTHAQYCQVLGDVLDHTPPEQMAKYKPSWAN